MKQLCIAALALVLLTSCQPHRQTTAKQQLPPPPPLVMPKTVGENPVVPALREAAALMRELTLQQDAALPNALLNRTRCVAISLQDRAQGLCSCRSASAPYAWSSPEAVSFDGAGPFAGNILVFVISDRAYSVWQSGKLDLAQMSPAAGQIGTQSPTDRDLAHDVITYRYAHHVLSGAAVSISGIRHVSTDTSAPIPGGGTKPGAAIPPELSADYLNWVTSYFNAITPTGIIIHHSATIPAVKKVPAAFDDLDQFHAARGFAIECLGREYHIAYHFIIFP